MNRLTAEQVKGRIRNIAKQNNADARTLMRIYMMERFLERISVSNYKDNFVIKGGMLITSMVGVALRSTMDIDTTIRNQNLSEDEAKKIVSEICRIDIDDGVKLETKEVSHIMDEMEYPGIRFSVDAHMEQMVTPMKIDISTGDVITPRAIEYRYNLLLEDRYISLWSYNLETILAEKLQTILSRGIVNTRMRDFYDIYTLLSVYREKIDTNILKTAFIATCKKRGTETLKDERYIIFGKLCNDASLQSHWQGYQKKYPYAAGISYDDIMYAIESLMAMIYPEIPNAETIAAMEEAKRLSSNPNVKKYSSIEELLKALKE